jgi:hypothetical protein
MNIKPGERKTVGYSVKVYQWLLNAYPSEFRDNYGLQMAQVFRDCCLRVVRQEGRKGVLKLWLITLLDFYHSVFEQYAHKESDMSKSKFIKLSGWALIVGAFVFLLSFLSGSVPGFFAASILMAVGLLGLRARYRDSVGSLGEYALLAGVVGMVLAYAAVPIFRGVEVLHLLMWDVESVYILPFAGPAVLLTGLTVFGLAALSRKPLPQANWLPFFAGLWYPIIYFPIFFYVLMNNGVWPEWDNFPYNAFTIMMLIQLIALTLLGAILLENGTEEAVVPA